MMQQSGSTATAHGEMADFRRGLPCGKGLTALSNDSSQFLKQIHGVGTIMRPLGRLGRPPKAG
jgi:hypothetical protein